MAYIYNNKSRQLEKNNKNLIKLAGIYNILHGIAGTFFYLVWLLNNLNVIRLDAMLATDEAYTFYMMYQLMIVVLGIFAVVYSIRARQIKGQLWYMGSFAVAGINSTLLFMSGIITVATIFNIVSGISMIRSFKEAENDKDFAFGGDSEGLSKTGSTASIIDNMTQNGADEDTSNEAIDDSDNNNLENSDVKEAMDEETIQRDMD